MYITNLINKTKPKSTSLANYKIKQQNEFNFNSSFNHQNEKIQENNKTIQEDYSPQFKKLMNKIFQRLNQKNIKNQNYLKLKSNQYLKKNQKQKNNKNNKYESNYQYKDKQKKSKNIQQLALRTNKYIFKKTIQQQMQLQNEEEQNEHLRNQKKFKTYYFKKQKQNKTDNNQNNFHFLQQAQNESKLLYKNIRIQGVSKTQVSPYQTSNLFQKRKLPGATQTSFYRNKQYRKNIQNIRNRNKSLRLQTSAYNTRTNTKENDAIINDNSLSRRKSLSQIVINNLFSFHNGSSSSSNSINKNKNINLLKYEIKNCGKLIIGQSYHKNLRKINIQVSKAWIDEENYQKIQNIFKDQNDNENENLTNLRNIKLNFTKQNLNKKLLQKEKLLQRHRYLLSGNESSKMNVKNLKKNFTIEQTNSTFQPWKTEQQQMTSRNYEYIINQKKNF